MKFAGEHRYRCAGARRLGTMVLTTMVFVTLCAGSAVAARPNLAPVTGPTNLTAEAVSSSQINLTWTDNSSNETGFKIERSLSASSGFTQIASLGANVTTYADSGLSEATTYYYRVYAASNGKKNRSPYSNTASATTAAPPQTLPPPDPPSGLIATPGSTTQINLAWTDNSSDETGFKVERSLSASSGFAQMATVGAGVTSYANTGLSANTTYYYRVYAYNADGNSAYSNTASATTPDVPPAAPSNLTATAVSSSQINLAWSDNSGNETGFKIERSLSATSGFVQIAVVGANVAAYSNTSLAASTTYYYRVRAYNAGNSAYSNTASATTQAAPDTTPPSAPGSLTASAVSSTQIDLSWSASTDNVGVTGYRVYRSTTLVGSPVGTSWSDTGLTPSTSYSYTVKAADAAGNLSAASNTATATTLPAEVPPAAPSSLIATPGSTTQVNLAWSDNSSNETGFKIERSLSASTGFSQIATVGAGVTSYINTGLSPSTTYYYRVRAYNATGDSGYSNTAPATTLEVPPAAPGSLAATAVSSSQINLAWVDKSSTEDGFKIERSLSASSGFSQIATVGTGVTSYQNTGLSASTTYYYRVRAYNGSNSPYSNAASATTEADISLPVGAMVDVVTDGGYAYMSSTYGIVVADVSDPTHPRGIASVALGFFATHLDRGQDFLVATGGASGIAVVDIADPAAPALVGSLEVTADEVAVQGMYVYLVDATGYAPYHMRVVDLSDPSNPMLIGETVLPGVPAEVAVVGNYAYVAASDMLIVVDVSLPSSPTVVASLPVTAQIVAASVGYVYIDWPSNYGGIQVVDVSTPTAPTIVGRRQILSQYNRWVAQGGMVYGVTAGYSGGSFHAIDVSTPTAPSFAGGLDIPGNATGVAVHGDYAYVAGPTAGLLVIDVSDPHHPVIVGSVQ